MPAVSTSRVKGYRELNRAFARADKTMKREFKNALKESAEPVREGAERLAASEIRNIGDKWSQMRVGVTQRALYVAPKQRGSRAKVVTVRKSGLAGLFGGTTTLLGPHRPNLAGLLMDKAMQPALDSHIGEAVRGVERLLDKMEREWGSGG